MSFLSKHRKDEVALVFDIGSDGATGALVAFSEKEAPQVLFSVKDTVSLAKEHVTTRVVSLMLTSLNNVVKVIEKEGVPHLKFTQHGGAHIRKAYCVLSSPWYLSQTKVLKIKKPEPVTVTEKLISDAMEAEKKAYVESLSSGEFAKNFHEELEVVDSKIISIRLNGYETSKPHGKKASEIEINIYLSIAGKELVEKIRQNLSKHFELKSFEFHTFPLVTFSLIRNTNNPEHFLIMDIGAEVTDISIIKDNSLLQTVTLPLGRNFFVRKVSSTLNTLPQVGLSFLKLYAQNKTEPAITQKIETVLQKLILEWQSFIHKAFTELSDEVFVPQTVYLTTDQELMPFYTKLVQDQKLNQTSNEGDSFTVIPFDHSRLAGLYRLEGKLPVDPFIIPDTVFINSVRQKHL